MLFFALLLQSLPATDATLLRLTDARDERQARRERRYRLDVERGPVDDPKRAAARAVWRECGLTGAPVCPSRGKLTLRATLETAP